MIDRSFYKCLKSDSSVYKQINDIAYFEWITFLYPTDKTFLMQAISMTAYLWISKYQPFVVS